MSNTEVENKEDEKEYLTPELVEKVEAKDVVTDIDKLRERRDIREITSEEIAVVSAQLFKSLVKSGGVGLAANQIDLPYRACIVNVKEPLVLINPRIVKFGTSDETEDNGKRVIYYESCLSLPKTMKKPKKTVRFTHVVVQTDNLGLLEFGPDKSNWRDQDEMLDDVGLLESVVVQHEINHLDGKLITDNGIKYNKQVTVNKIGRNEKVMIMNPETEEISYMKYKHAQPLVEEEGYEILSK